MIDVIAFEPEHVQEIELQPIQLGVLSASDQYLWYLQHSGPAFTGRCGQRIIGCAGVIRGSFGVGWLWALIGQDAPMLAVHRCAERFLDMVMLDMRRLEASTEVDFSQGCRWLEMLGFEHEGLMRKFGPDGRDHMRYARVS